jgi:molecular chaperone DnaJ
MTPAMSADNDDKPKPTIEDINATFGDLFSQFFGGNRGTTPARGRDLRYDLTLRHTEARDGTKQEIAYRRRVRCASCEGTGARGGVTNPCTACTGTGQIQKTQGFFTVQATCGTCRGTGAVALYDCDDCEDGTMSEPATVTVAVPAGIENGQTLRLAHRGDDARRPDGEAGHLYIVITVDAIGALVREGDDVVFEVAVGLRELLLGGTIEVATLDGPTRVRVPRNVRDGAVAVLANHGHIKPSAPAAGGDPYRDAGARGEQRVVFRVAPEVVHARMRLLVSVVGIGLAILALVMSTV